MLNLVCRNKSLRETVLKDIKSVFRQIYSQPNPQDINETLYVLSQKRNEVSQADISGDSGIDTPALLSNVSNNMKTFQELIQRAHAGKQSDLPKLTKLLDKLNIC